MQTSFLSYDTSTIAPFSDVPGLVTTGRGSFSIEFLLAPDTPEGILFNATCSHCTGSVTIGLALSTKDELQIDLNVLFASSAQVSLRIGSGVDDGVWHTLELAITGTTNTNVSLFLDGVDLSTTLLHTTEALDVRPAPTLIGGAPGATSLGGCVRKARMNGAPISLGQGTRTGAVNGTCQLPGESVISFASDGYAVYPNVPQAANSLYEVSFRTNTSDGLLLYQGSESTSHFMAIEIVEGAVSFVFDLGVGQFDLSTESLGEDGLVDDGTWFRVAAEREGLDVRLTLSTLTGSTIGVVNATAPTGNESADTVDGDIYVGGHPDVGDLSVQASQGLRGCVRSPLNFQGTLAAVSSFSSSENAQLGDKRCAATILA